MPKERDENKIQSIIAATLKLVIETGFIGFKMADVAKEAGIATGTLYIYFKNKEELINEAYLITKKEVADVFTDLEGAGETFFESFSKLWHAYFEFCLQHTEKMLFVEQFIHSGFITADINTQAEHYFDAFNQFLLDAQGKNYLRRVDINLLKAQLMGPIHEVIKASMYGRVRLSKEKIEQCFQMAWNSVRQ